VRTTRSPHRLIALLAAFALAVSACGDDDGNGAAPPTDGDSPTTTAAEVDPERCPVDALDDLTAPSPSTSGTV
jgi:hypothetical protein